MPKLEKIPRMNWSTAKKLVKEFPRVLVSYDISDGNTHDEVTWYVVKHAEDKAVINVTSTETAYTIFIDPANVRYLLKDLLNVTNKYIFQAENNPNVTFEHPYYPDRLIVTPVVSIHKNVYKKHWYQFFIIFNTNTNKHTWCYF